MIDSMKVPPVESHESLARFVLQSSHIRKSDGSLKLDAFMPPPNLELSVSRHLFATEDELWTIAKSIADPLGKTLYGRGDIRAGTCQGLKLHVQADPVEGNPNHAIITRWPTDKPAQKSIAQQLAATAKFTTLQ